MKKFIIKNSPINSITIIYTEEPFIIEEIILSNPEGSSDDLSIKKYGELESVNSRNLPPLLKRIVKDIIAYLNGENIEFNPFYVNCLNLSKLTPFQEEVLIAEFETDRGSINTYKELAERVDNPKAYRAVGSALANNPFPLIIPCHRTIKSNNTIGGFDGYSGGLETKRILLEIEGLEIEGRNLISNSPIISLDKSKQTRLM